ncbi:hypothetical protein BJX68DRAFT_225131 [Aspergillus pseudodeflectus]|uniref:Uncharacterized protein n=1 Tax=Aspergillus pseudodeflectus TaxID=176178 RepID=A0ABR4L7I1_9EURO
MLRVSQPRTESTLCRAAAIYLPQSTSVMRRHRLVGYIPARHQRIHRLNGHFDILVDYYGSSPIQFTAVCVHVRRSRSAQEDTASKYPVETYTYTLVVVLICYSIKVIMLSLNTAKTDSINRKAWHGPATTSRCETETHQA